MPSFKAVPSLILNKKKETSEYIPNVYRAEEISITSHRIGHTMDLSVLWLQSSSWFNLILLFVSLRFVGEGSVRSLWIIGQFSCATYTFLPPYLLHRIKYWQRDQSFKVYWGLSLQILLWYSSQEWEKCSFYGNLAP